MNYYEISPFKLLKPYGESDGDRFFGRAKETRQLADALLKTKFILLYGASGTGKTSLIQCGLQGKFSPRDWLPIFVRRGNTSFPEAIREALLEQYKDFYAMRYPEADLPPTEHLTLRELVKALFDIAYLPVYLILDQFEEIFTLGNEVEQDNFFEALGDLKLFNEDLFCKMLIVVREEYIAHFYRYENAYPFLFEHRFRVEKMRVEQLEQAVLGTLTAPYDDYPDFEVGPGVPAQIVRNISDKQHEVDLTTLQVYLDRLYREDLKRMRAQGGEPRPIHFDLELVGDTEIKNVLSDFLDQQLIQVNQRLRVRHAAELQQVGNIPLEVLLTLVTEQRTRRNDNAEKIHQKVNEKKHLSASLPLVQDCLDELASQDCRILTELRYAKTDEPYYELVHDRLAEQVALKASPEEQRYREAISTLNNKWNLHNAALRKKEYLSLGELELIGRSVNLEGLEEKWLWGFYIASDQHHQKLRRRQNWVTLGAVAAAVVFAMVALFAYQQSQKAQARELASKAFQNLATNPTKSFEIAREAYKKSDDPLVIEALLNTIYRDVYRWGDRLYTTPFYSREKGHKHKVTDLCFSPNGKYFATTSMDSTVIVWQTNPLKEAARLKINNVSQNISFHPDGQRILVGTRKVPYAIQVLRFSSVSKSLRVEKEMIFEDQKIGHVAYAPNGSSFLVSGMTDRQKEHQPDTPFLYVYANLNYTKQATLSYPNSSVLEAQFSKNSNQVYAAYKDSTVIVWNTSGEKISSFRCPDNVSALTSDSLDHFIFCGLENGGLFLKDMTAISAPGRYFPFAHKNKIYTVELTTDELNLVTSSIDGGIRIWSWNYATETFKPEAITLDCTAPVFAAAVSKNNHWIAAASLDCAVYLWQIDKFPMASKSISIKESLKDFAWSPSPQESNFLFATASDDNELSLIDTLGKEKHRATLSPNFGSINSIDISHKGRIAVGTQFGHVILYNNLFQEQKRFETNNIIESIRFSPDGNSILTALWDSTARLWNNSGKLISTFQHESVVLCANFSPDGRYILTGGREDMTARLWDIQGNLLSVFKGHYMGIYDVCMSPDGKMVATAGRDNTIRLWDRSGHLLHTFEGEHTEMVNTVIFSNDGKLLISSSQDKTIKLWRLEDNKNILTLKENDFPVKRIYYDAGKKQIISATEDGVIEYWDTDLSALLKTRMQN